MDNHYIFPKSKRRKYSLHHHLGERISRKKKTCSRFQFITKELITEKKISCDSTKIDDTRLSFLSLDFTRCRNKGFSHFLKKKKTVTIIFQEKKTPFTARCPVNLLHVWLYGVTSLIPVPGVRPRVDIRL